MNETQPSESGSQDNDDSQTSSSSRDYVRRGVLPGVIAGLIIGPCATFGPFLFFGGQAADSFTFLFAYGLCCLFGLGLGLFNGAIGGAAGGYFSHRFGGPDTVRLGSAIGGAIVTGGVNVIVIAIMIATNFV
jgi:hypothetical protein